MNIKCICPSREHLRSTPLNRVVYVLFWFRFDHRHAFRKRSCTVHISARSISIGLHAWKLRLELFRCTSFWGVACEALLTNIVLLIISNQALHWTSVLTALKLWKMSLTEEQIKLVQSSWDVVKSKGDFETHGLTLFERYVTFPRFLSKNMFPMTMKKDHYLT